MAVCIKKGTVGNDLGGSLINQMSKLSHMIGTVLMIIQLTMKTHTKNF